MANRSRKQLSVIKWITKDIVREKNVTIKANNFELKDLEKLIPKKGD